MSPLHRLIAVTDPSIGSHAKGFSAGGLAHEERIGSSILDPVGVDCIANVERAESLPHDADASHSPRAAGDAEPFVVVDQKAGTADRKAVVGDSDWLRVEA